MSLTPGSIAVAIGSVPMRNVQDNWPLILDALRDAGVGDMDMQRMAAATIAAEVPRFSPISEGVSRFNTPAGGPPFSLYDFRHDLGNNAKGDGLRYRGHGYIQLTGKDNHRRYSAVAGCDLVAEPERANEPKIAARILAAFLRDNSKRIRKALAAGDLAAARKAVNGGTHGIETFAYVYKRLGG